jgi:hypothetical protein
MSEQVCTHPKLFWWHTSSEEWLFLCSSCDKRLRILVMDMIFKEDSSRAVAERMVEMIGAAYGVTWQEKAQQDLLRHYEEALT